MGKNLKNRMLLFVTCCIAISCTSKSGGETTQNEGKVSVEQSVNSFLDEWHLNAAEADMSYFDKMANKGIYIGTDPTEYWTTEEFREWSKKYFERGKAWDFKAINRNVYSSENGEIVWFDELLDTWMGICRGSGVIVKETNSWRIAHYHLSIAIPNESTDEVIKVINTAQLNHEKAEGYK